MKFLLMLTLTLVVTTTNDLMAKEKTARGEKKCGINSYSVFDGCEKKGFFRGVEVQCHGGDGYAYTGGYDPKDPFASCLSAETLYKEATLFCEDKCSKRLFFD